MPHPSGRTPGPHTSSSASSVWKGTSSRALPPCLCHSRCSWLLLRRCLGLLAWRIIIAQSRLMRAQAMRAATSSGASPSCAVQPAMPAMGRLAAIGRVGRQMRRMISAQASGASDVLLRGLTENGQVSVMVAQTTRMVQDAQSRHGTAPTATAALGRALTGALLMGAFRKDDESVQISFNGRGPLGTLTAIADTRGQARAFVANPAADPPLRPDGKLDVGAAVGSGVLSVVRSHPLMKEPYTGVVPIHSGEVAEDLAVYLADSEQTQSALGLGVSLDRNALVRAAGGFLVTVLPFAEEDTIAELERTLSNMRSVSELIDGGMGASDIARQIVGSLGLKELGTLPLSYGPCGADDLKQRMKRAVATLGEVEVRNILEQEGFIEVTCEFCKDSYKMTKEDIDEILMWSTEFNRTA